MRCLSYEEATNTVSDNPYRFEEANVILHAELGRLCAQGDIFGAFLFGSASFKDTNAGSDRDLLVTYEGSVYEREQEVLPRLHDVARDVYAITGVPLEVTCASLQQLEDGEHGLARGILRWLRGQVEERPEDCIGQPFIDRISRQRDVPPTEFTQLEAFLARTHHTLQKEYLQGCYFDPHKLLGFIFSLPHIATRKTVEALRTNGFAAPHIILESLAKTDIAQSLLTVSREESPICQLYAEIAQAAQTYFDDFLPAARHLTREEYDQITERTIDDLLPKAIYFATRMQMVHRCGRAHLRLLVDQPAACNFQFSEGDEDKWLRPFLPADLRALMRPVE